MCDTCNERGTCPFYEAGINECVYEMLIHFKEEREG